MAAKGNEALAQNGKLKYLNIQLSEMLLDELGLEVEGGSV